MNYILIRWIAMSYVGMAIFISVMWKDVTSKNKDKWFLYWLVSPISFLVLFFYSIAYTFWGCIEWLTKKK